MVKQIASYTEFSHKFAQKVPKNLGHQTAVFHNRSQVQSVSKTFKKCYHQNQKNQIQKREMHIASRLNIDAKDITTTYVVDPNRTELNDNEKRLKYHGPMDDLFEAINIASNGDTKKRNTHCFQTEY
eukprot:33231_1